jgi:hypothetical protein
VYHRFDKKSLYALIYVMAILVGGCQDSLPVAANQSSQQSIVETMVAEQLIIKFKPNTISCDTEGIAQLYC